MKSILKILSLIFVLSSLANACALCAAYTPSAHVSVKNATINEHLRLESLTLAWSFLPEFSEVLLQNYDLNNNLKFDRAELEAIKYALLDYVNAKHQLTFIYKTSAKSQAIVGDTLKFSLESQNLSLENEDTNATLLYEYTLKLDASLKEPLAVKVFDDENFFNFFFVNSAPIRLKENLYLQNNANINVSFLSLISQNNLKYDNNIIQNNEINTQKLSLNLDKNSSTLSAENANLNSPHLQSQNDSFLNTIFKKLQALNSYFIALLKDEIHSNALFSTLILMALSLIYGMFHALAPGHSKFLIGSYFLAHESSYLKALSLSIKIALTHIISAFLLVFAAFFALKSLARSLSLNYSFIITQFSSLLILFLALYLLSKKILSSKNNSQSPCPHCAKTRLTNKKDNQKLSTNSTLFAKKNIDLKTLKFKSNLSHPKSSKFSEFILIIAAGIVPCPTMVLVFSLAFEFGTSKALLSALFIALGMALVLFVCAVFSSRIKLALNPKFRAFVEYLALIFMILLALFIFFNAKKGLF